MTTKAAKKTAKKSAKKAAKRAGKAGSAASDRAADMAERAGTAAEKAGTVASERAVELAERLRESEALHKAQEKGVELADLAKGKWRDAEIDERAAELAERLRESDTAKQASRKAKEVTDTSLAALGAWLAAGPGAEKLHLDEKLGIQRKRRIPAWLWALIGAAMGFAAAKLMADSSGGSVRDDLAAAADRLAQTTPNPATTVLADTVRTTLQGDPRTADLKQVNINVADGTVFVRGSIPSGIDADAIREVIEGVPGVEDVDLQLTPVG
jgi:hypothetical protein